MQRLLVTFQTYCREGAKPTDEVMCVALQLRFRTVASDLR